jgi:hypothetical protein
MLNCSHYFLPATGQKHTWKIWFSYFPLGHSINENCNVRPMFIIITAIAVLCWTNQHMGYLFQNIKTWHLVSFSLLPMQSYSCKAHILRLSRYYLKSWSKIYNYLINPFQWCNAWPHHRKWKGCCLLVTISWFSIFQLTNTTQFLSKKWHWILIINQDWGYRNCMYNEQTIKHLGYHS